jgi:hypothetical protein
MEWLGNVSKWQESTETYCEALRLYRQEFEAVLRAVKHQMSGNSSTTTLGEDRLLSKFHFSYQCGAIIYRQSTLIEPLIGALGSPLSLCRLPGISYLSRYYFIVDFRSMKNSMMPGAGSMMPKPTAFLFDLGASSYLSGSGGASQTVLIEAYQRRGIVFDRILLWEANTIDP